MNKEELERLVKVEEVGSSNTKRIDKLETTTDSIHELAISTKELAIEVKAMREEQNKIDKRVSAIEEKPVKRFDSIITVVITAIISGIIAFLFAYLGLK